MQTHLQLAISPQFEIHIVEEEQKLSPQMQHEIDANWETAFQASRGKIYNGKLLNFIRLEEGRLIGSIVDYKSFFVQCTVPVLSDLLQIVGVGVRGITIAGGEVLLGRRAPHMPLYPDCYEFAPGGSLDESTLEGDKLDYRAQLVREFVEETGWPSQLVQKTVPFGLVWNGSIPVIDICLFMILSNTTSLPPLPPKKERGSEYSEIAWVPFSEMDQFIAENEDRMLPTTKTIFALAKEQYSLLTQPC